jgi:NDP-hexose-3-ketoreductase
MQLKIGILGTASIAQRLVIPALLELSECFKVVAVASRFEDKAINVSNYFNIESIVGYDNLIDRDDVDALYIPLPIGLHFEWAIKALNAKKHILVEKSFALNFDQTQQIVELASANNLLVMENFMFKYHRQHDEVWRTLKSGAIGDIKLFRSQFGFPALPPSDIRYSFELGGGSLLDAGAYTIMASRWFLGNNQKVLSTHLNYDPINKIDISGAITLLSSSGVLSQNSFGFDNFYKCNYEIWGSNGSLHNKKAFTAKKDEEVEIVFETQNRVQIFANNKDNQVKNMLLRFYNLYLTKDYKNEIDDILDQSKTLTEVIQMSKL